ncbi:ICOS ligand-like isoform 2-T2 [Pholidichthys leucotaenia]
MVGRPVSLPCFTTESLTFENMTMEWRTDRELVLRSVWKDGDVDIWSLNSATFSADAALMGNLTLGLPAVKPKYDRANYSLFIVSGEERLKLLCTICLRIAASFSSPQVLKEDNTSFLCHSSGGYPLPTVYWLINDTEEPPEGSVRTQAVWLPESVLYNVTSLLTVNISQDDSVSCVIENPSINQTVSTVYGVPSSTVVSRASNGMWIFSTALCVVVGIMVLVGVAYQIHLDRVSKRKKKEFQRPQKGYKRRPRYLEEIDVLKYEPKESDV